MDSDRDMLIRIEQKLSDSISNYKQMVLDLKEIFGKIETNSKSIVSIDTTLKTMKETEARVDTTFKEYEEKYTKLQEKVDLEENVRIAFENDIKGGQRVWKWVLLLISCMATILSIVSMLWNLKP